MTTRGEREADAAVRAARAVVPQVQAVVEAWQRQHGAALARTVSEVMAPQYQRWLKELFSSFPRIEFPALKLDYTSLFPDFGRLQADLLKSVLPSLEMFHEAQRQQFAQVIAVARQVLEAQLPPNWRGEDVSIPTNIEALLLDEGLALAWVPPPALVARLFNASSASERRRIIGARWKSIAAACLEEIEKLRDTSATSHAGFAKKAAEALLAGCHEASQALSANLLDTVLRAEFSATDRESITSRRARLDIDEYPLRVAIVLGGIWGAHGEFWPDKGDKIPRGYSRHGSAHGVSRRQYSRINAVLALMHVVSLLRLIEVDLREVQLPIA
jgi:hypothetical protein